MEKTYTTIQGDMWDSVAYKALGSVQYTGLLMMCNRQYLGLYTFPAGVVLQLPEVGAGAASGGLPPWKAAAG